MMRLILFLTLISILSCENSTSQISGIDMSQIEVLINVMQIDQFNQDSSQTNFYCSAWINPHDLDTIIDFSTSNILINDSILLPFSEIKINGTDTSYYFTFHGELYLAENDLVTAKISHSSFNEIRIESSVPEYITMFNLTPTFDTTSLNNNTSYLMSWVPISNGTPKCILFKADLSENMASNVYPVIDSSQYKFDSSLLIDSTGAIYPYLGFTVYTSNQSNNNILKKTSRLLVSSSRLFLISNISLIDRKNCNLLQMK